MVKQTAAGILLALLLGSCAAHLPYPSGAPLSTTGFSSPGLPIRGFVPAGWFAPAADTSAKDVRVLLVRDDLRAAIAIREITLNPLALRENKGLSTIARLSAILETNAPSLSPEKLPLQEFTIGERKFCGYELGTGVEKKRVIVFGEGGRYYQCEATPLKGEWNDSQLTALFAVQQTILSTIRSAVSGSYFDVRTKTPFQSSGGGEVR